MSTQDVFPLVVQHVSEPQLPLVPHKPGLFDVQTPLLQYCDAVQAWPQLPQLLVSALGS